MHSSFILGARNSGIQAVKINVLINQNIIGLHLSPMQPVSKGEKVDHPLFGR